MEPAEPLVSQEYGSYFQYVTSKTPMYLNVGSDYSIDTYLLTN